MWKTIVTVICFILIILSILLYFFLFRTTDTDDSDLPSCIWSPDNFPRVENLIPCSNRRYYDKARDRTLAVMSPDVAPLANQICKEWCGQLQLPNTCLAESQAYITCLTELQPTNCIARANPAATTGNEYAYVIGRGNLCF